MTDVVYTIVETGNDRLSVMSDKTLSCLPVRSVVSGLVIVRTSHERAAGHR